MADHSTLKYFAVLFTFTACNALSTPQCVPVLGTITDVRLTGKSEDNPCNMLTSSSPLITAATSILFVPGSTIPSTCSAELMAEPLCEFRTPRRGRGKGRSKGGKKKGKKSNSRNRSGSQGTRRNNQQGTFEITFQVTLSCNTDPCILHIDDDTTRGILQDQRQELRDLLPRNPSFPSRFNFNSTNVKVRVRLERQPQTFCNGERVANSIRSGTRSRSGSRPVNICDCPSFCPVFITTSTTTSSLMTTTIVATPTAAVVTTNSSSISMTASATDTTVSDSLTSTPEPTGSGSGDI